MNFGVNVLAMLGRSAGAFHEPGLGGGGSSCSQKKPVGFVKYRIALSLK